MSRSKVVIDIKGNAENFNQTLNGIKKETRSLSDSLESVATKSGIAFAGLATGIGLAVNQAAKFEQISTQFEVLTGSAEKASGAIEDLKDFSAGTPFQFDSIAKAGSQLLGFGFQAEELRDRLEEIGNVAAASGKPIDDIALIFGQVSAAGKLTGERLLQLQERAIPIGPALAKTMGVAEESIKDLVSDGAVSFEIFQEAFASLSKEGGAAFGALEKQSGTVSGKFSTLGDNVSLLAADFGQVFLPAVKAVTDGLISFIKIIRENQELTKYAAVTVGVATAVAGLTTVLAGSALAFIKIKAVMAAAAAASPLVAGGFSLIGTAATAAGTAIKFAFANPVGLAITAIAGLVVAAFNFRRELASAFSGAMAAVEVFTTNAGQSLKAFGKILAGIATFNFSLAKQGFSELTNLENEGRSAAESYQKAYQESMEQFRIDDIQAEQEKSRQRLDVKAEENEALLEQEREFRELQAEQKLELDETEIQAAVEKEQKLNAALIAEEKKRVQEQDKIEKQEQALRQKSANAKVDIANATANLLTSVSKGQSKEAFLLSRAAGVAQSIISTNVAAAQALANPPGPPATIPLATQTKVAGALNTAAILATTFQAAKGFSGSGSAFGESFVSTFTPREIVVPERFSEGIKKGEYDLTSRKQKEQSGSGAMQVIIGFTDDAFEIIEEKLIERDILGRSLRGA